MDPDLVSLLEAEGVDELGETHALGRAHWVRFFAEREHFTRDFVEILDDLGLTWDTAAGAPRLQCPVDEMEIGVAARVVATKLGAQSFADVYRHPRDEVERAMGERSGLLGELEELLGRAGLDW